MWHEKIDIHAVLTDANKRYDLSVDDMECPADVKESLASEVSKSHTLIRYAAMLRDPAVITVGDVNDILNSVFGEADRRRVWCGMPSFS